MTSSITINLTIFAIISTVQRWPIGSTSVEQLVKLLLQDPGNTHTHTHTTNLLENHQVVTKTVTVDKENEKQQVTEIQTLRNATGGGKAIRRVKHDVFD